MQVTGVKIKESKDNEDVVFFDGKEYLKSELSKETLEWLSLSKEERALSSYFPPEFESNSNSQTIDTGAYPPCVMVDGIIYKDTGYISSLPGCGTMDGKIESTVAGTKMPTENNQSNFGSGYEYQISSKDHIIVMIDGKQEIFRNI
ncbi:lipoprotein, partial [gut metagenome]